MKRMKTGWLLYDERDYEVNRLFASHMHAAGAAFDLSFSVVLTERFEDGLINPPDFVVSRQRNFNLNARLEAMGIPVFNNARVSEICNDKRNTHRFLQGVPLMPTQFAEPSQKMIRTAFPCVVKPAFGHGGDRVTLTENQAELDAALQAISPLPALVQEKASDAGKDLRVYVLFGEIVAAVLRTAAAGIVSNYKRGGSVKLHTLTRGERELATEVIRKFASANAPLSFAGVDLIYHHGKPVVNEIEDVVGSRMLYEVSDLDVIALYAEGLARAIAHDNPPLV